MVYNIHTSAGWQCGRCGQPVGGEYWDCPCTPRGPAQEFSLERRIIQLEGEVGVLMKRLKNLEEHAGRQDRKFFGR